MKVTPNPRLMKIIEIQNSYQKHRKRLLSIQHLNLKEKPSLTTLQPSLAVNNYRQNKLNADIYTFKSTNHKIKQQNLILLSKIQKQYNKTSSRQNISRKLQRSNSNSTIRSSISSKDLITQNKRLYVKLNNTKSIYSKFRQSSLGKTDKSVRRLNSKEELLNLLVNQLGVKPSVLFPNVRRDSIRRTSEVKVRNNNDMSLRFHENMIDKVAKKHNFANNNKSKN